MDRCDALTCSIREPAATGDDDGDQAPGAPERRIVGVRAAAAITRMALMAVPLVATAAVYSCAVCRACALLNRASRMAMGGGAEVWLRSGRDDRGRRPPSQHQQQRRTTTTHCNHTYSNHNTSCTVTAHAAHAPVNTRQRHTRPAPLGSTRPPLAHPLVNPLTRSNARRCIHSTTTCSQRIDHARTVAPGT